MSFFLACGSIAAIASRYSEAVAMAADIANKNGQSVKIYKIPALIEKTVRPQTLQPQKEEEPPAEQDKPKARRGRKK